ncbi:MAG: flagellar hook-associated protein FlgK [Alphaproteobacteria bacterium]|nr:flagellar hook-associated protein FlgK [Alphaproteobacteria bacterium]
MSLSAALSGALSGLQVTQRALEVTSGNIQNASTPGYARRTLEREALGGPNGGVRAIGVGRAAEPALQAEALRLAARQSGSEAAENALRQVLEAMGGADGSAPLARAAARFADGWRLWQADPEDDLAAAEVVARGDAFAGELRRAAAAIEAADRVIAEDTARTTERLNAILGKLAALNARLSRSDAADSSAAGLTDQRDALLSELATIAEIRIAPRSGGAVAVFSAGGMTLLDAAAERFTYMAGTLRRSDGSAIGAEALGAGRLPALLAIRADSSPDAASIEPGAEALRKLRERLDALARQFTEPSPGGAARPPRFADAYDAAPARDGTELAGGFFTGTDRFTFAVNPALMSGTVKPKPEAAGAVADAIAASGRSLVAGGLAVTGTTLTGMAEAIVAQLARDTAQLADRADTAAATAQTVQARLANATGVNLDAELAQLQLLQTAYAAVARVFATVQAMHDALDRALAR